MGCGSPIAELIDGVSEACKREEVCAVREYEAAGNSSSERRAEIDFLCRARKKVGESRAIPARPAQLAKQGVFQCRFIGVGDLFLSGYLGAGAHRIEIFFGLIRHA